MKKEKRLLSAAALLFAILFLPAGASAYTFDPATDYMELMVYAAKQDDFNALKWYEHLRNWKIATTNAPYEQTDILSCDEIKPAKSYSDEDLYWLARVIYAEAGADSCPDWVQQYVGWVVMNRRDCRYYPDTIQGVIFDSRFGGQYGCVNNGSIYREPNQRAVDNAAYCLANPGAIPSSVMGQGGSCGSYRYYTDWEGKVYFFHVDI